MFGLFKKQEILDEDIILWLFECYGWALKNFDAKDFFNKTDLIKPNNTYFGGEENSVEGMAHLIFGKVTEYAGVAHWPFRLINENEVASLPQPQVKLEGTDRGRHATFVKTENESDQFVVTYNEFLLSNPEVLIASYSHAVGYYLGLIATEEPPGGKENMAHATELLAVFLGFGVIMANSANTRKIRSCSSCSGPAVERLNYLSEFDTCYALAIFTRLKGFDSKEVLTDLKKNLRPFFKNALKDLNSREALLKELTKNYYRKIDE